MDREQFGAALDGIGIDLADAASANERATAKLKRIQSALAPPAEPPVEPEPEPPTRPPRPEPSGLKVEANESGQWSLTGEGELHKAIDQPGYPRIFVRANVIVADGVRLSVVTLSHSWLGEERQRGPSVTENLPLSTEGGLELLGTDEPLVIPPGQSLTVWGYEPTPDYAYRHAMDAYALRYNFWSAYAADSLPRSGTPAGLPHEYEEILERGLDQLLRNPQTLGPYHVAWDAEGYGHGGQGIEPDGCAWRKTPAGLALSFEIAMSTMNRMQICITDEEGTPTFDPDAAYTTTHNAHLPKEYDWNPHDPELPAYAAKLADYKRIDGQHFARVYRDLVFLAQMCPDFAPARAALRVVANWLAACSIATGFDSGYASNPHYWSLGRKLDEIKKSPGVPSKFCGRAGMHEARCALEILELFDDPSKPNGDLHGMRQVLRNYLAMIVEAANENGVSYGEPASAVDHAKQSWGKQLAAQPRELRLALLLMEDVERSRYVNRAVGSGVFYRETLSSIAVVRGELHNYLGSNAGAAINLETGEKAGSEHWGFPLATHGVMPEGLEKLKADAASRSTEGGGSQPLNYDRHNLLGVGPRRGVVS